MCNLLMKENLSSSNELRRELVYDERLLVAKVPIQVLIVDISDLSSIEQKSNNSEELLHALHGVAADQFGQRWRLSDCDAYDQRYQGTPKFLVLVLSADVVGRTNAVVVVIVTYIAVIVIVINS